MQGESDVIDTPVGRLARLGKVLRATLRIAADVALPQLCAACREPVDGPGVCPACWAKLSFIAPP
jgi:Double zinc ribbon domain